MTVADWSGAIAAIIAVVGMVLAGVKWIVGRAVKDVKDDARVAELEKIHEAHVKSDDDAFARVDERLEQGGRQMREMRDELIEVKANVTLLVDHFVGGAPESRRKPS